MDLWMGLEWVLSRNLASWEGKTEYIVVVCGLLLLLLLPLL